MKRLVIIAIAVVCSVIAVFGGLIALQEFVFWQAETVLEIEPNHVDVLYKKGVAIYDSGKYRESIKVFDMAITINPNHIASLYYKGHALYRLDQYEESIIYYDKILVMDPNHVATLLHKGYALYDLGRFEKAIQFYDKVLAMDPKKVLAMDPNNIDAIRDAISNKNLALQAVNSD